MTGPVAREIVVLTCGLCDQYHKNGWCQHKDGQWYTPVPIMKNNGNDTPLTPEWCPVEVQKG